MRSSKKRTMSGKIVVVLTTTPRRMTKRGTTLAKEAGRMAVSCNDSVGTDLGIGIDMVNRR
jgi:hypothetical protein